MLLAIIIAIAAVVIIGSSAFVLLRDRRDELVIDDEAAEPLGRGDTAVLDERAIDAPLVDDTLVDEPDVEGAPPKPSFRDRLATARSAFGGYLGSVFSGGKISAETWDDLEEALIRADVGVATSTSIIDAVRERVAEGGIEDTSELPALVKAEIVTRLTGFDRSLSTDVAAAGGEPGPAVWLFVGVNGVGKTTTIGKLASRESAEGKKLVLAAGDTFRAAAAEQLTMWAERSNVDIVRGAEGADPSSVVFDAVESANAKNADLVMADTAGRLQNKTNLMEELGKVRRVAEKGAGTVTETLLVIDATTGQNGMSQAATFAEVVNVTGVVLTKLDGSAKGGIVIAIHSELNLPVKLVGLGEGINDLVDFDATEFVDALFE